MGAERNVIMTYETEGDMLLETLPEDRVHFMRCSDCGKWWDMRQFDDLAFHCFGHIERPDFNVQPGIRVSHPNTERSGSGQ